MKLLEKLFSQSRLVDDLLRSDLTERSTERKACAQQIERLTNELGALQTDQLAKAEKAVADAALKLENARREYADLTAKLEQRRRELSRQLQTEEQKLQALKPLIIQQLVDKLDEKRQAVAVLTPAKFRLCNEIVTELGELVRVVDDDLLLKRIEETDRKIDNALSAA
ncbi:hypothetical protein PL263_04180 [Methylomonas sp. EFPC3]|uniref:hypothetical protein n=1 Tax=Methylomonas sp. EFPC3 TaxID=3021710 RepID=UPI00241783CB|nr:hypothetical protein [Methylomonas sp. EFPC3]WFP51227.1 hypothetical protein PL263_04180 [Methylomonas sp. EFPC3]